MQTPRKEDEEVRYLETCPACGASNGVNATECWQCEGTLRATLHNKSAPPEPSVHADDDTQSESVPSFFPVFREAQSEHAANDGANTHAAVLIGAVPDEAEIPQVPAHGHSTSARRWAIGAGLIAVAVGLAWFMPAPPPQEPSGAIAPQEQSGAITPLAQSPVAPSTTSQNDSWDVTAMPKDTGSQRQVSQDLTPPPNDAGSQRQVSRAPTAMPNDTGSQRQVNRSPFVPAPPVKAKRTQPAAAAEPAARGNDYIPPPPPVRTPCTRQVAALGLCTPEPG